MSESAESGPPQFVGMIAVGLQALAAAFLVSWLVLFHGRRAVPEGAQSHERTNTEALATEGDGETADELDWNEAITTHEPVPFDKDPFSLLHFASAFLPATVASRVLDHAFSRSSSFPNLLGLPPRAQSRFT